MTIHLTWWAWFGLPLLIIVVGFIWASISILASISERNDSGMCAGMAAAVIFLLALLFSVVISIGLLIGHFL